MLSETQLQAEPIVDTKEEKNDDNVQNSQEAGDSLHLTGILSQTQEEESQEYCTKDEGAADEQTGGDDCKTEHESDDKAPVIPTTGDDVTPATEGEDRPVDKGEDSPVQDIVKESDQLGTGQTVTDQVNQDAQSSDNKDAQSTDNEEQPAAETPQVIPDETSKELPITPAPSQPVEAMSAARRRQMLLEASLEKLKGFTPKLAGSPEGVIDLEGSDDDEDVEPEPILNPGVMKLMRRFEVHSRKPAVKKKRQVEVRWVDLFCQS